MQLRSIVTTLSLGLCVACGSSSKTDTTASASSDSAASPTSPMYSAAAASSVGVYMTDAPANLALLASVNVSLDKVQVHVVPKGSAGGAYDPNQATNANDTMGDDGPGQSPNTAFLTDPNDSSIDDDDHWQTITLANSNFNLLALQGNVTAVVGGLDLPTGVLTQIRLFIDPNGTNDVVLDDASVCSLDVSSVVARGFKIGDDFPHIPLHDGNTTNFVVDFDLENSLSQDGNCAFSLHPVFHLRKHEVQGREDGGWAGQHPQDGNSMNTSASAAGSASAGNANTQVSAQGSLNNGSGNTFNGHVVGREARVLSAPTEGTQRP